MIADKLRDLCHLTVTLSMRLCASNSIPSISVALAALIFRDLVLFSPFISLLRLFSSSKMFFWVSEICPKRKEKGNKFLKFVSVGSHERRRRKEGPWEESDRSDSPLLFYFLNQASYCAMQLYCTHIIPQFLSSRVLSPPLEFELNIRIVAPEIFISFSEKCWLQKKNKCTSSGARFDTNWISQINFFLRIRKIEMFSSSFRRREGKRTEINKNVRAKFGPVEWKFAEFFHLTSNHLSHQNSRCIFVTRVNLLREIVRKNQSYEKCGTRVCRSDLKLFFFENCQQQLHHSFGATTETESHRICGWFFTTATTPLSKSDFFRENKMAIFIP